MQSLWTGTSWQIITTEGFSTHPTATGLYPPLTGYPDINGVPVSLAYDCPWMYEEQQYGEELVTNGGFDTDITGWNVIAARGSISWDAGRIKVTNDGADSYPNAYQHLTTIEGRKYKLTADVEIGTADLVQVRVYGVSTIESQTFTEDGTAEFVFIADSDTTPSINLYVYEVGNTGHYAHFDNVSVKELTDPEGASKTLYWSDLVALTNLDKEILMKWALDGRDSSCHLEEMLLWKQGTIASMSAAEITKGGTWSGEQCGYGIQVPFLLTDGTPFLLTDGTPMLIIEEY